MRFPLSDVPLFLHKGAVRLVHAKLNTITPAPPSVFRELGCRGGRGAVCIQYWAPELFKVILEVFSRTTLRYNSQVVASVGFGGMNRLLSNQRARVSVGIIRPHE